MLKDFIEKLIEKKDLSSEESSTAIHEILESANLHQVAAFLVLMRAKGETVDELVGFIQAMQHFMVPVEVDGPVMDIVGTGGDGSSSINISTGACLLAASCGVKIAKHGNRSVSSLCGSADLLEALSINITMDANQVAKSIEEVGMGFMFAPLFHPAMKSIAQVRRDLKIKTAFNLIGPLLNPARAEHQLIGVYDERLLEMISLCLFRLGTKRSFVVHSNGLDELSTAGPAKVVEVTSAGLKTFILEPSLLGLPRCTLQDLKGSSPCDNAECIEEVFSGKEGPIADTLALNAGVALHLYDNEKASSIQEGVQIAKDHLKNGSALKFLNKMRTPCQVI